MKIHRWDLDGRGYGSPKGLANRIHELIPELPFNFSTQALASELGIAEISVEPASGFQALLVTKPGRSRGGIILAEGQSPERMRFSVGHELGHFLLPSHEPDTSGRFVCSQRDMNLLGAREKNRRDQMEVQANEFSARLLIPLHKIRQELRSVPDLNVMKALAGQFRVSKEAMARSYAEYRDDPVAIVVTQYGKFLYAYCDRDRFPWLALRKGDPLPNSSEYFGREHIEGAISEIDDVDPEDWLSDPERDKVLALREQLLWQQHGFAMVLLQAELDEDS
ncbi:MAG: ImmA/IrrE family metallo-endopeptidase [Parasphingopyxis sp.]|uniref:ImmA/IrrE family metallo-endopeptidase n=1 Tax=Parasphingopyxis sp. TaxID=1920299 RepID=UPI0032EE5394